VRALTSGPTVGFEAAGPTPKHDQPPEDRAWLSWATVGLGRYASAAGSDRIAGRTCPLGVVERAPIRPTRFRFACPIVGVSRCWTERSPLAIMCCGSPRAWALGAQRKRETSRRWLHREVSLFFGRHGRNWFEARRAWAAPYALSRSRGGHRGPRTYRSANYERTEDIVRIQRANRGGR
jgi:hypothetical protein